MESSKIFGSKEECNSCESGWTMYIGSPIYGDDVDACSDEAANKNEGNRRNYNHAEESDDSMASDASSGPSHQGTAHFKHEEAEVEGNRFERKAKKSMVFKEKAKGRRSDEMVEVAKRVNPATQNGSKVRKNNRMGKRM
ncbi:hypothetical protein K2173_004055 [Erythroxylum novogranatense]|uniref:Uncharacterized protein n=1 Tax=Erythroxylum novogranatense TaxID=1862640 RepID=A0AAV8SK85_9ROSI|nr:hypothetical protein K2173_004055 [Erythroxylum novogranatense]